MKPENFGKNTQQPASKQKQPLHQQKQQWTPPTGSGMGSTGSSTTTNTGGKTDHIKK